VKTNLVKVETLSERLEGLARYIEESQSERERLQTLYDNVCEALHDIASEIERLRDAEKEAHQLAALGFLV